MLTSPPNLLRKYRWRLCTNDFIQDNQLVLRLTDFFVPKKECINRQVPCWKK
nr:MAG TPA: hypothetical protein [Caudoviricetes sp.]